ncbi:MAG: hypothetical protein GOVbin2917_48 [Prokaryotic dsDNA virus sp.]|jgi:tRNA U34 5-carboxymethylaminomethyl modifying GTPase MnmE/TrmE|nr:MAG: hypothetical protein GOVbin2917_48 [Prokaryotic dsDNA virus sp.]|tara:strand:+ start:76492 stop:76869 length:378 start_codon:yes stop_codon:yes gene_type:complete
MALSPEHLSLIATAIASGSGIGNAWFWYDKKRGDKKSDEQDKTISELRTLIEAVAKQQVEHDNKFITEEQTRKLLQEYLTDLKQSWADTNSDVKEIKSAMTELTMQLRVLNAVRDIEKELTSKKE